MEEYMNATGGPGGYVQTTANQDGYVWDPNATPDTPGFIEPGKNVRLSTGEYLYYTNESDVFVSGGFKELERSSLEAISYKKRATNWLKDISFSDVGHCVLDFAGMIPLFGAAADAINVGWYLLEGNGEMAAYSVAAVFGGSAGVIAAKYGGAITKVTAKMALNVSEKAASRVNKVFGLTDEVLSSADDVAKQADEVVEGVVQGVGHTTPWSAMTRAEKRAFQHSYSRHSKELGLPNWAESKAADLQGLFNEAVTNIRNAGSNSFFLSQEWVNGVMTTVNRTEPIINGQKYFYYETLQGVFISAGKIP
jgi:hypothetical protein